MSSTPTVADMVEQGPILTGCTDPEPGLRQILTKHYSQYLHGVNVWLTVEEYLAALSPAATEPELSEAQRVLFTQAELEVIDSTPPAPPSPVTVEAALAAARELIDGAQTTYRARNGRQMSLEADDGERCYIVHNDLVFALAAVLRALAGEKRDG